MIWKKNKETQKERPLWKDDLVDDRRPPEQPSISDDRLDAGKKSSGIPYPEVEEEVLDYHPSTDVQGEVKEEAGSNKEMKTKEEAGSNKERKTREEAESNKEMESMEETEAPKKSEKPEKSEKKSSGKKLSFFTKLSLFVLLISILMAVVFWFMHRIPSMVVAVLQVLGVITALIFHKDKKSKKRIYKVLILLLVVLIAAGNIAFCVRQISHSRDIADKNAALDSTDQTSGETVKMPVNTEDCIGLDYSEVYKQLKDAGFTNVDCIPLEDLEYSESDKIGTVAAVSIGSSSVLTKNQDYDKASRIVINYHDYRRCTITLNVNFEGNLLFNKYDVTVLFNDVEKGTMEHGKDASFTFTEKPGSYTIRFESTKDASVMGEYKVNLKGDINLGLQITCDKDQIKVKEE